MCREIPLTQGKSAIVDDADYKWLNQWKWTYLRPSYAKGSGYAYRQVIVNGKQVQIYMHRFLTDAPKGAYVDHINHDGLDNRRDNLRIATPSENHYNSRPRKNTTSKYKGVCFCNGQHRWSAEIRFDKKKIFLGYFDTELDAAAAYNIAATQAHGDFALPNDLSNHIESTMLVRPKKVKTSSARGVHYSKQRNRWIALYKRKHIGTFATEQEAIEAIALIRK